MKEHPFIIALLLLIAACSGEDPSPKEVVTLDNGMNVQDVRIGAPVTHRGLVVFPLYLDGNAKYGEEYLTLEEALASKAVEVREVGADRNGQSDEGIEIAQGLAGTVNAVEVENHSDRPLYILAGQVIVGGKQDRVITKDTIVPPGEQMNLEVCCVEQGRWSPRGGAANPAGNLLFCNAAKPVANMDIKRNIQAQGSSAQQVVWEDVAVISECMDADSPTSTYLKVVEKTEKEVDEYLEPFMNAFEEDGRICGFVACLNGEVATCDLFLSSTLLSKFKESLLRGYALDALDAGASGDTANVDIKAVQDFIAELGEARKNASTLAELPHSRIDKLETPEMIGFCNTAAVAEDTAGPIHVNAYRKMK